MTGKKDGFLYSYSIRKTPNKGLGVFSEEAIKQGSIVWRHVPGQYCVYDETTFKALISKMTYDEVVYELTHVFGLADFPDCVIGVLDAGVLLNHSCEHNLVANLASGIKPVLDKTSDNYIEDVSEALLDDRYALIATSDINVGEEFTTNYALEIYDPLFLETLYKQFEIDDSYIDNSQ
ncbi:MAG: SET domain-containing protein-lysine N-methyltransferase [Pseudomonadota bacterium]